MYTYLYIIYKYIRYSAYIYIYRLQKKQKRMLQKKTASLTSSLATMGFFGKASRVVSRGFQPPRQV